MEKVQTEILKKAVGKGPCFMTAKMKREDCIGCGKCEYVCPEVFRLAEDGYAKIIRESVPKEALFSAVEAQDECPASVIRIDK